MIISRHDKLHRITRFCDVHNIKATNDFDSASCHYLDGLISLDILPVPESRQITVTSDCCRYRALEVDSDN